MSLTYTYDGVAVTHNAAPAGLNVTHRADGEASFGGIPFEDPTASLVVVGHKLVTVEEDECAQPRLFTGFTTERAMGRSVDEALFVGANPRLVDMTVVDMNAALGFRQITGSDGNRPAETWADRLTWILESDYLNEFISSDQTWIVTNTTSIEAADYRSAYATAVLDDLVDRSGGAYVYFAFWDAVASEVRLFFDNDVEVIGACTLSISNVDADVDGATVFAPTTTSKLAREPDQTYSDVTVVYDRGAQKVHRYRASTATTYVRRGTEISRPYTRGLATATAQAEAWLDKHAVETDRITCSIQVPADSVGLIQAGQSIEVKLTHLGAPYTSYTTMRIVSCSPKPTNDTGYWYDVALELVYRPAVDLTGVSAMVALYTGGSTSGTRGSMPDAITAGWSQDGYSGGSVPGEENSPAVAVYTKAPAVGESATQVFTGLQWSSLFVAEFAQASATSFGTITEYAGFADTTTHTKSFTADGAGVILAACAISNRDDPLENPTPTTAGFVELWESTRGAREWAAISIGYLPVTAAGSYSITWTTTNTFNWGWTAIGIFLPDATYVQSGADLTTNLGEDATVVLGDDPGHGAVADTVIDLGPTPGATTEHKTDPTVTDDAAAGYTVGGRWINTATGHEYVLVDSTTGAAVWVSTTAVSVFNFSTSDGTTTVDPTTELTFVGGVLADLGGGVAELTLGGGPATTVTDETTWGITPAVGSDDEYARQDHTHGSPDEPMSTGELLVADAPLDFPHGTFFTTATQTVGSTTTAYAVAFAGEGDVDGLTHSTVTNNSRVYIDRDGEYNIIVSAIGDLTSGTNQHIDVWLAIDGTPVDDSNTIVQVVSTAETLIAASFNLDLNAGQYFEIMYHGDSTACQLLQTAAASTPTRPASPAVILTVNMESPAVGFVSKGIELLINDAGDDLLYADA